MTIRFPHGARHNHSPRFNSTPRRPTGCFGEMVLIRRFEERTEEQYTRARIGGYCHLAIGEEASVVGAIDAMQDGDCVFASYRDHGTALAVGSPPGAVMAELFGKVTGVGPRSWRLDAPARRRAPLLRRLGHRRRATCRSPPAPRSRSSTPSSPSAVLCQFGDGAVATGAFHEALNLAAVWQLPIVFQVINNQYGMGTSVDQSAAEPDLWKRAAAYRMHGERIDGNDLMAVREAAARLLREARVGAHGRRCSRRSPTASAATRWPTPARCTAAPRRSNRGSSATRSPASAWCAAEQGLLSDGDIEEIWREVNEVVKQAIDEALSAADPDRDSLYEHLYGDAAAPEQFRRMHAGAPFGERGEGAVMADLTYREALRRALDDELAPRPSRCC